ncbi:MAG TPA: hypothetical protein VFS20_14595 [Longimicrobium sp.]|nr:hypothetical protein [Longimicrobium sp.]
MAPATEIDAPAPPAAVALTCTASVAAGSIDCVPTRPLGARGDLYLGGQGVRVRLTSSNVSYDNATNTLRADVTVENLLSQPIGTLDGTTVSGVKVFFHTLPTVTSGTGTASVQNADGVDAFTASGQPYFFYNQTVQPNATSAPRTWKFTLPATVQNFVFSVYVAASMPIEKGVLRWEVLRQPNGLGDLKDVWGTSENSVFVVSSGRVRRWNGSAWTTLFSDPSYGLYTVTGTSDSDLWVGGTKNLRTVLLHFDGTTWTPHFIPQGTTTVADYGTVNEIVMFSPTSGIAVANNGSSPAFGRWDGTAWTDGDAPAGFGLHSAWGSSPDDFWIAGQRGQRWRYKDGAWQNWSTGVGELNTIWGTSASNVWFGPGARFDGTTFQGYAYPVSGHVYYGMWGTGPNDVYAAGYSTTSGGTLLHWNGTAWSTAITVSAGLHDVWGTPGGKYFAVGDRGTVLSNTDGSWKVLEHGGNLLALALAMASDTSAYAVGENGTVLRWAGGAWSDVSPGGTTTWKSVWHDGSGGWYVAGGQSILRSLNGGAFTVVNASTPGAYNLNGIWGASANDIWAVGAKGILRSVNGGPFQQCCVSNEEIHAVWGTSAGNVYAVGNNATLMHYVNGTWRIEYGLSYHDLYAVSGSGPNNVWAVGEEGMALQWDGTRWKQWSSPYTGTTATFRAVAVMPDGTVYVAGDGGVMLQFSNGKWRKYSGVVGTVYGMAGTTTGDVFAVGASGQILRGLR